MEHNRTHSNEMKAAVVGLGVIGAVWAGHLDRAGILKASWNRSPKLDAPKAIPNLTDVPELADIIHIVVSDEVAAADVVEQLLPRLHAHHLVIQSTTIDPQTSTRLKQQVEARGAHYVECPFTGSLPAAIERKTVFFVGATGALFDRALAYLRNLSETQFCLESNQAACMIKLAMNLQIASAMNAMAEALTICRETGIPDGLFFDVFRANASYSGVARLKEARILENDFSPQFSTKHMAKDMRLLLSSVKRKFGGLLACDASLKETIKAGFADEDFSSILKWLSKGA
jgi:3-hydroxyisobutyrate dehydrogenase-like beta-hydroxyacid dehydrogenase